MKLILLTLFLMITYCYAEPTRDDIMHITAHFGGAYAITHTITDICVKTTGKKHKVACTVTGVVLANVANVAYKAEERFPSDTTRSLTSGMLGSATAAFMITLVW